jgi:hypothetical protein
MAKVLTTSDALVGGVLGSIGSHRIAKHAARDLSNPDPHFWAVLRCSCGFFASADDPDSTTAMDAVKGAWDAHMTKVSAPVDTTLAMF